MEMISRARFLNMFEGAAYEPRLAQVLETEAREFNREAARLWQRTEEYELQVVTHLEEEVLQALLEELAPRRHH